LSHILGYFGYVPDDVIRMPIVLQNFYVFILFSAVNRMPIVLQDYCYVGT